MRVADHAGGVIAAAPVHNLEALIYSTAVLDGNRAISRNIAPHIQLTTAGYGDAAAGIHVNKGSRAMRTAFTSGGILCGRNTQSATDRQIRAFCHRQRTIRRRRHHSSRIYCRRFIRYQRIRRIVRNEQRHTAGNGIIARRQYTIVQQNNGLIAGGGRPIHRLIQIAVYQHAVNQEVGIAARHHSLDRGIGRGIDRIRLLIGKELIVLIHPAQERIAACSQDNTVRRRNIRNGYSGNAIRIHSFTCDRGRNRAKRIGIFNGNRKGLIRIRKRDAAENHFVFSRIRACIDKNCKRFSSRKRLAVVGHSVEVLARGDTAGVASLDGIDIRLCHVKRHGTCHIAGVGNIECHAARRTFTAAASVFTRYCSRYNAAAFRKSP